MRSIVMTQRTDFVDALAHRGRVLAFSVGANGEAVVLIADEASATALTGYDEQPGWASFPRTRAHSPALVTVLVHDGTVHRAVEISPMTLAFPLVQPLPDGEILIVGTRCQRFEDGTAERNARVFGPDGTPRREMTVGDGVADVQVTASGDIWVSYFDEGIFGNFGWGMFDSPNVPPIGSSGLVRFSRHGHVVADFRPPKEFDTMADCYALNVANEDVWFYYYTDFPLVRVADSGGPRGWHTGIDGAVAFAIDDDRVLFYGGYPPHENRCMTAVLGDLSLIDLTECRLLLPSGEPVRDTRIIGRGPVLHAFIQSAWYSVDIRG